MNLTSIEKKCRCIGGIKKKSFSKSFWGEAVTFGGGGGGGGEASPHWIEPCMGSQEFWASHSVGWWDEAIYTVVE